MGEKNVCGRIGIPRSASAAALALMLAVAPAAFAEDEVPIPRPDPRRLAATQPAPAEAAAEQPPTGEQLLLLQGANSPFADAAAIAAEATARPDEPPDAPPATALQPEAPPVPATPAPAPQAVAAAAAANALAQTPTSLRRGAFTLEARMWDGGPPLGENVAWRIFDTQPIEGKLPLLGEASGGLIHVRLDPGTYIVHAAYGRAGATQQISVTDPSGGEVVVLNAGGMRLFAVNAEDQQLRAGEARFDIYAPDDAGSDERFLIVSGAPPGRVISLNAGTYHVVSRYGDANAIIRADIRVDAGQLTEATIFQRAARLTLKLVEQRGGEAIANTEWSIVNQAGENVIESVGAFPEVVLAEGEYIAIARNNDRLFEATFTVAPGEHRDVEVLLR